MSTPTGDPAGNQWARPGDPAVPVPSPAPSGYGTPSSPSYGKYGQGQAVPIPPAAPAPGPPAPFSGPPQPQWGPPGQPQWGRPGYTSAAQWSPPSGPTELNAAGGLGTPVILLAVLMSAAIAAVNWLSPNQNQAFRDAFHGVAASTQSGSQAYRVLSSLGLLVEVVAWVLVCLWLTRVRQNAMILRPSRPRHDEVWVWLGWVIPVVNFWFPKQIVDDVIEATASATGQPRIGTGGWWTAWMVSMLLSGAGFVANMLPPNDGRHLTLAALNLVAIAVAALLWIRIVRWVSTTQDARLPVPGLATLGQ